jgi:hypothetical protein
MDPSHETPELNLEGRPTMGATQTPELLELRELESAKGAGWIRRVLRRNPVLGSHLCQKVRKGKVLRNRGGFQALLGSASLAEMKSLHLVVHDLGQMDDSIF